MRPALLGALLCVASVAHADDIDLAPALTEAKKPRWEPRSQDAQTLRGRARTKLNSKKYEDAVPMYLELMALQPGCGVCLAELTRALARGEYSAASLQAAEHLTTLYPAMEMSWSRRLEAADLARDHDLALEMLTKLQGFNEKSWTLRWDEVDILLQLGRFADAKAAIEAAGENLDAGDAACMMTRVAVAEPDEAAAEEAWATCEADGSEGVRDRVEGWRSIALKDWKNAALHAAGLGDSAAGDLAVAYLRLEEGKPESAVNLLNAAVEHHPNGKDLLIVRALAQLNAGDSDGAKASLDAAEALGDAGYWVLAAAGSDWADRMAAHQAAVTSDLTGAADEGADDAAEATDAE
jgi:tetratricopeptide (TPR) repeat protein